jgi:hypothetical protein
MVIGKSPNVPFLPPFLRHSYLIVEILRALKDAPTHLHDRGDRHQERDDPHDGANLRKNKEEKEGGGRRKRAGTVSPPVDIHFLPS